MELPGLAVSFNGPSAILWTMAARVSDGAHTQSHEVAPGAEMHADRHLLHALANGERWAADSLYDQLYPGIASTLQRILNDRRDYDDLVQTTFERIIVRLLGRSTDDVRNLTTWASGIAAHVALDFLRTKSREDRLRRSEHAHAANILEVAGAFKTEQQIEARDLLSTARDVLAGMKSDLAEAVLLHDMAGYDLREIAEATETSVAAAQSRLVRGRKEFLRRMELRLRKVASSGSAACVTS